MHIPRGFASLVAALLLATTAMAQPNTLTDQEKADGWSLLFDGKDLDGWTTSGDLAAWAVEQGADGPALTMAHPGHGEWLRTTKMYRDFELLVDFDVAKGKNSGIGLRGSSCGDPAFTGMEVQVFGNQGEKPTITSCGSVYDAIAPTAMPLKDGGQWNTFRIKLVGDTINIWLNGEQVHKDQKLDGRGYTHKPTNPNPLNSRCRTGYIALQDHGDKVRYRNIRIKDLSPDKDPGGFEPIFNGKDTRGWTNKGPFDKKPRIEDGVLVIGDHALVTEAAYEDVEVRAFVRTSPGAQSSFGLIAGDAKSIVKDRVGDNTWRDYRVRVADGKLDIWINGSHSGTSTAAEAGERRVLIGASGGDAMFKDVQVRALTK